MTKVFFIALALNLSLGLCCQRETQVAIPLAHHAPQNPAAEPSKATQNPGSQSPPSPRAITSAPITSAPAASAPTASTSTAQAPDPQAMHLPATLRRQSRFEPSGLLWWPAWQRYIVVSDDTGLADSDNEHQPWVFSMNAQGQVDADPIAIVGVEEVTDLESISAFGPNTVLLLASQSKSKKGKRKPPRCQLILAGVGPRQLRSRGAVDFSQLLLDAAQGPGGSGWLQGLGLRWSPAKLLPSRRDFALDIEGMLWWQGQLLLGLKSPQDAQGQALLWTIKAPQELMASGQLRREQIRIFARLSLRVTTSKGPQPGGIADLIALTDQELLVAVTAPSDPQRQDGALWQWRPGNPPQMLRTFTGLKAEGLSLGPKSRDLMVVFDRGAQIPLWTLIPHPTPLP